MYIYIYIGNTEKSNITTFKVMFRLLASLE